MIAPFFSLPIKHLADQDTQAIPAVQPLFQGRLPLPPSVNQAYKIGTIGGHSRIIASSELEAFKLEASVSLFKTARIDWKAVERVRTARQKTALRAEIQVYFPTQWKRDLDGPLKFVIDAVFDYLKLNDNRLTKLNAEKLVDACQPRVELSLFQ